eukprot:CAMPEP_0113548634 /NCGR_PEP_ID=MMETSP0015_2-20120614/12997_1 /TAXON_ID=2838 /ORGANISM="Odontella" /LENGTH=270 /DNA_ID=CAMNT_0000449275 /DNA_START=72 /DNA_END=884 /DNA_ORIENTATION=+ /assembly_acc=CAM_ASM_000160
MAVFSSLSTVIPTLLICAIPAAEAFQFRSLSASSQTSNAWTTTAVRAASSGTEEEEEDDRFSTDRRSALSVLLSAGAAAAALPSPALAKSDPVSGTGAYDQTKSQPDFVQKYEDFALTDEGWSYKDVKPGAGDVKIETGDRVVFDWSGYTIGYFGRPFEAKGGPQGGAFDKDLDYSRTVIGSGTVVPGLDCALRTMKPGGIRQVVVPYGALSYPPDDLEHNRVGPKPTTFSGQRALNFVLENPRVDRTLLFNVKVVRIDKKDGKGGFIRG